MNEWEIIEIVLNRLAALYSADIIIADFLAFIKRYRNTYFLYL